ncbi:MAG: AsnC family transcriptional regulator, partial [Thermoprotei archaeon]
MVSESIHLDNLDKQILEYLKYNSRISFRELATKLGKPVSTIYDRVKRLEKLG